MRKLVSVLVLGLVVLVAGSGGLAGLASAQEPAAAGSAEPGAAAAAPSEPEPVPVPVSAAAPAASPGDLRKTCVDAMNADPTFAKAIVETADKKAAEKRLQLDLEQHETAAKAISKNERHVVIAYMSMWLVAVAFVLFLFRRQQRLNLEISQLRRDLEAASKDGK